MRAYLRPVEVVDTGAAGEPWAVVVSDENMPDGDLLRYFGRATDAREWAEVQWPGLRWQRRVGGGYIAERLSRSAAR